MLTAAAVIEQPNRAADVTITQVSDLFSSMCLVRYSITEIGGRDHASYVQELPTVYSAIGQVGPDLWRLMDASGNRSTSTSPQTTDFVRNTS